MSDKTKDYLADHKRRKEEEAVNRKQARHERKRYYEEYVQLWNAAWDQFDSAFQKWYTNPGADGREKLSDALREIVREVKRNGHKGAVRNAAERCRTLAEKDPTGEMFDRCDVSDTAAVLAVLSEALDDDTTIEPNVKNLVIECSFIGGSVRSEIELAPGSAEPIGGTAKGKEDGEGAGEYLPDVSGLDDGQIPVKTRYKPPNCPKCKGRSKVDSTRKSFRYLKCRDEKCDHTWTLRKGT